MKSLFFALILITVSLVPVFAEDLYKELWYAIYDNDFDEVARLVELGVDLNYDEKNRTLPLALAVHFDNPWMFSTLLYHGADINCPNCTFNPLEQRIMRNENDSFIRFVIDRGADIEGDRKGSSPLIYALHEKNSLIVEKLLREGAITTDALEMLAVAGDTEMMEILVSYGAQINGDDVGASPLKLAISSEHLNAIKELTRLGADIEYSNGGQTPLELAISFGSKKCVELLLELGADLTSYSLFIAKQMKDENEEGEEIYLLLKEIKKSQRIKFWKDAKDAVKGFLGFF